MTVHLSPFHCSTSVSSSVSGALRYAPVAMHADALVQETPDRKLYSAPTGIGTSFLAHVLPFHMAENGTPVTSPPYEMPTATHDADEAQETSSNGVYLAGPLGVDCVVHDVPFQRIASVSVLPPASNVEPTAVQAFAALQETSLRLPAVLGVSCIDQLLPFQLSASA
jgi:hypothetical protein